jgi:ADP-heptose:LPS heptosyltransferase
MSHIAEVYAKDLGVKIGKPTITDHFYAGLPSKYITLQASNKMPAANYKYWDMVISLIKPHIQDTKILQVGGGKDQKIIGVDKYTLGCSFKQMNYIIKKSSLHIGCDSLPGHVASAYDIPSIILHFNLYPSNSKPIWNKESSCISMSPDFSEVKPSFGLNCNRINEIKPEDIAQNILNQLGVKEKINFKTIRIGKNFTNETIEIVPNFSSVSDELKDKPINIRGDLHWDAENICRWCHNSYVNLYIKSSFDTDLLQHMPKLKQLIYIYKGDENTDVTKFLNDLKNRKVNIIIQTEDIENISDIRFKYFDFPVIEKPKPEEKGLVECKYISRKKFASEGEIYNSEFSAKRLDKTNKFVYNEVSKLELESLYLYDEK